MIYIIVTLLSMLLAFGISLLNFSENIKKKLYIFSFLPLTILGAIRYLVGIDYHWYSVNQIPQVLRGSETVKFEYLPRQIVYFGDYLAEGMHYDYIFAIFHIVIMYFMYKYIVNESPYIGVSIFLVVGTAYYNFALSGMRQAMASMIAFYGLTKLKDKKYIHFIFWVVIATLFHTSAIIYLALMVLELFKISDKVMVIGVAIAVALPYIGSDFISVIMDRFGFYEEYVGHEDFYGRYQDLHQWYSLFLTFWVIVADRFTSNEFKEQNRIYLNLNYLILIFTLLMSIIPTPSRIIFMFLPVEFILIPKILENIFKNSVRREIIITLLVTLIVITIVFFYIFIFVRNNYQALPYRTIFDY